MHAHSLLPHLHSVSCMNDASTHVLLQDKFLGSLHSIQEQAAYKLFLLFVRDLWSVTHLLVMLADFMVLTWLPASAKQWERYI